MEIIEKNYKLYNNDCVDVMDLLIKENVQIDLTVTSPPYDDIRDYNNSLVWNFDIFKNIAKKLYDLTKEGGVVVWVVGDKTKNGSESGTSFKQALYFKEIGFNLHDTMIYAKENPIPLNHNRYEQQFEYMFVLVKGKLKCFNPIKMQCKNTGKNITGRTFRANGQGDKTGKIHTENVISSNKTRYNIWFYNVGFNMSSKDKIAFEHPAIFPEKLAEDHILSWSNEGELVFDPFMGSNTTGKMAILNNRKFIGIEKEEKYFNIAKERIKAAYGGD